MAILHSINRFTLAEISAKSNLPIFLLSRGLKDITPSVWVPSSKGAQTPKDSKTGNYLTFGLLGTAVAYAIEIVVTHSI